MTEGAEGWKTASDSWFSEDSGDCPQWPVVHPDRTMKHLRNRRLHMGLGDALRKSWSRGRRRATVSTTWIVIAPMDRSCEQHGELLAVTLTRSSGGDRSRSIKC